MSQEARNTGSKTGFLVIAGPEDPIRPAWTSAMRSRLSSGCEVYLYLIDRGVFYLMEEGFFELCRDDLRLYACAYGSRRYGIPLTKPAVFSGLTVLNDLVTECKEFIAVAPTCGEEVEDRIVEEFLSGTRRGPGRTGEIVFYIRWNPRESHLSMEGLRIASGLTIGSSALKICLNRQSTPLLSIAAEEIIDGEKRDTYLDILRRSGAAFYHEGEIYGIEGVVESRSITAEEKEQLLSSVDRLIVI